MEIVSDVVRVGDPNDVAVRCVAGGTVTYASLADQVELLAAAFADAGLRAGDVATLVLGNSLQYIVAFLAVVKLGAIAAPLNQAFTEVEFTFYMKDASASLLIIIEPPGDAHTAPAAARNLGIPVWRALLDKTTCYVTCPDTVDSPMPAVGSLERVRQQARPTDPALFLHTSGTTSRPKGVPLSHENIAASLTNIVATYALSPSDATLLVMPLFHVHGLMAALLSTLASGGTVVIPPGGKFSASTFWQAVAQNDVTWYTAVPTIHQILLLRHHADYPSTAPPKLRFIRSCSASLAPAILARLEEKFGAPVLEAYAMTEAAHQMCSNPLPENGPHKPGSVGPGQNVQVVIMDEANVILESPQVGEVCIQGRNVTNGYSNNPKANETAFSGGWFHTGDQGFLDRDGYLTLTGRLKELINRGGEKISPIEVDAAILAHPAVAEAVSFAAPDEKYGEEVNAAIVLKENKTATTAELVVYLSERLAAYKIPKQFFFAETLPKTATGKTQRRIIATYFLQNSHDRDSPL